MVISLVPKGVAQKGYQFTHLGSTQTCQKCNLLSVCVNSLETGSTYEVIQVREKEHPCLIDNSMMVVCELKQKNDKISVRQQKYLDNVVVTRETIDCVEILCENYDYCVSEKYSKTTKIKILKNLGKINCPLNYQLVLVEGEKITK
ncbi:MAG: hypothetical protein GOP50_04250 [Candidatus Heimdallarchaeota archaeon]|nr:hypothetical protein [Candidatus Heimdallarchaeota archaeon]